MLQSHVLRETPILSITAQSNWPATHLPVLLRSKWVMKNGLGV